MYLIINFFFQSRIQEEKSEIKQIFHQVVKTESSHEIRHSQSDSGIYYCP